MQRRSDGSIITTEVIQDDAYRVARKNGATHRDGMNSNKFYKQELTRVRVGFYQDSEFYWRSHHTLTHMPMSAGVI